MKGNGDIISNINPNTMINVTIGVNIKLARGETIDISPKQYHEKKQVETTAVSVTTTDMVNFMSALNQNAFFLKWKLSLYVNSEISIMPKVARNDIHRPISDIA